MQVRHIVERDRSRRVLVAQLRSAAVAARRGYGSLLTQAPWAARHRCEATRKAASEFGCVLAQSLQSANNNHIP